MSEQKCTPRIRRIDNDEDPGKDSREIVTRLQAALSGTVPAGVADRSLRVF